MARTRYSLIIGILAALIDLVIGVIYGGIAGMGSPRVDAIMMRIAEVIYSIPYMLVVVLLTVVFSTSGSGTSMFVNFSYDYNRLGANGQFS